MQIAVFVGHSFVGSSNDGRVRHKLHAGSLQWAHKGTMTYIMRTLIADGCDVGLFYM